jgi:hypothetical protein
MAPRLGPVKNAGQIHGIPISTNFGSYDYSVLQYNGDYNKAAFGSLEIADSIRLMAGSASIPDENPANFAVNILSNGLPEISVGYSNDNQEAYFTTVLPMDWRGDNIYARVEWSTTSDDTSHGAIFEVWAALISPGDPNNSTLTYIDSTVICMNSGEEACNNSDTLDMGIPGGGRKLLLLLKRDKTGESTDTLDAEVKVTMIEISFVKQLILRPVVIP